MYTFEVNMHSEKVAAVNHTLRFKLKDNRMVHYVTKFTTPDSIKKNHQKPLRTCGKKGRNVFLIYKCSGTRLQRSTSRLSFRNKTKRNKVTRKTYWCRKELAAYTICVSSFE